MRDDPGTRLRNNATEIASLLVTGLWLALLVSGIGGSLWLAVLLLGYIVVVPLVALLYGDEDDIEEWWDEDERERLDLDDGELPERVDDPQTRDALETLRDRYAAGDLTDEQFEHKLERLLEVETVEDAAAWRRSRRAESTRDGGRESGEDRDRDFEYET
ncbi:SHOCT domain-containing protein [Natrononativus amylolyticus]|uniref:SHOCT domain-containing protein n=1 Tax=Natrononativus amylolyticus TaxID=2963434 RepID=UPI0020CEF563|nr:SHOCT domain-containing protein [Natrononativus amylolyticus]